MGKNNQLLFICTGNYYRSRFAEEYFNLLSKKNNLNWVAISRGLDISNPDNKGIISPYVIKEMFKLKKDNCNVKYPCMICDQDFSKSRIIIALNEYEHRNVIEKEYPIFSRNVEYWDVKDLYEASSDTALNMIKRNVDELIIKLKELR